MSSFLKVPQRVHHGLRLVTALAQAYASGQSLPLDQVAEREGISRKFLEEIAGGLRRAGIVEGRRGAAGGYVLARDPRGLSVREVLAALDGPVEFVECLGARGACPRSGKCVSEDVWRRVQREVLGVLEGMTVAKVAGLKSRRV